MKCALELLTPSAQQWYQTNKSIQSPQAEHPWASPHRQNLLTGAVASQPRLILHQRPLAHMEPLWQVPRFTLQLGCRVKWLWHRGRALLRVQSSACTFISFYLCCHVIMIQKNNSRGKNLHHLGREAEGTRMCSLRKLFSPRTCPLQVVLKMLC